MAGASAKIPLHEVDDTPLVEEDYFDVKKELLPVASKWKEVGSALGVRISDLDSIEVSYSRNQEKCLTETLSLWLRRSYNIQRFGLPSWQRLVEVVADHAGGSNPALANGIAKSHTLSKKIHKDNIPEFAEYMDSSITDGYFKAPSHDLVEKVWYHGHISRDMAEERLEGYPVHAFLVRDSTGHADGYVLCVKQEETIDYMLIKVEKGSYELQGSGKQFQSISTLIKFYQSHYVSIKGMLTIPCVRPEDQNVENIHNIPDVETSAYYVSGFPTRSRRPRCQI